MYSPLEVNVSLHAAAAPALPPIKAEWSKNLRFTAARKAALALNPDKSLPDFFFCLMRYSLTAALFAASQAP